MGILNITPDSFFDGGKYNSLDNALFMVEKMLAQGADIIDIGGESTRPSFTKISDLEEIKRLEKITSGVMKRFPAVFFSIDTYKKTVARWAAEIGIKMINSVHYSKEIAQIAALFKTYLVIMDNSEMQIKNNFIKTVASELEKNAGEAIGIGVERDKIILDPGFGFGKKTHRQNFECIKKLAKIKKLGYSVLVGVSNKSSIGEILDKADKNDRLYGTLALNLLAVINGANIIRVHEVKPHSDAIKILRW